LRTGFGGAADSLFPWLRAAFAFFDFCFKAVLIQSPTEHDGQALLLVFFRGWL
jgi:hypothetical protein